MLAIKPVSRLSTTLQVLSWPVIIDAKPLKRSILLLSYVLFTKRNPRTHLDRT